MEDEADQLERKELTALLDILGHVTSSLDLRKVTGAIVGGRNSGQIDGFVGALEFRLSDQLYEEIGVALPDSIELM